MTCDLRWPDRRREQRRRTGDISNITIILDVTFSRLAMSHHRLNHDADAKKALDAANERMRTGAAQAPGCSVKLSMTDWFAAQIIAREAEEMIRGKPPATAPAIGNSATAPTPAAPPRPTTEPHRAK